MCFFGDILARKFELFDTLAEVNVRIRKVTLVERGVHAIL